MRHIHRSLLAAAALALAALPATACGGGRGATPAAEPRASSTVISGAQLAETRHTTVYDLVRELHPRWLTTQVTPRQGRGADSDSDVLVYLDDRPIGGTGVLRTLSPSQAGSVRYYGPSEATITFGEGKLNGVIQVVSPRG